MPWTREENIICVITYEETKTIQNCLKTDVAYKYDFCLLLKKKLKKKIAGPRS